MWDMFLTNTLYGTAIWAMYATNMHQARMWDISFILLKVIDLLTVEKPNLSLKKYIHLRNPFC